MYHIQALFGAVPSFPIPLNGQATGTFFPLGLSGPPPSLLIQSAPFQVWRLQSLADLSDLLLLSFSPLVFNGSSIVHLLFLASFRSFYFQCLVYYFPSSSTQQKKSHSSLYSPNSHTTLPPSHTYHIYHTHTHTPPILTLQTSTQLKLPGKVLY